MASKILIIEDEEVSAIALEQLILSFGYEVTDCVNNTDDALKSINTTMPDLIISDIMVKGGTSGCEFAFWLSQKYTIPFIFVTAYFDDELLDYALGSNVYGYLLKPFNPNELEATIKIALHKTNKQHIKNTIITLDTFRYNLLTKEIIQNDEVVNLGKKSRILLDLLIENKDNNVTYETLISVIYGDFNQQYIDSLRQLIKRLKERLNTESIISVKNIGYLIKTIN